MDHEALARRNRELEALYAVSTIMTETPDLDAALTQALARVLQLFGFRSGVIRFLDAPTGLLSVVARVGIPAELAGELPEQAPAGGGAYSLSVEQRALVVVDDLRDSPFEDNVWVQHGYRTYVSAPLQCRGMLLGTLNMGTREVRPFTTQDRGTMMALVNQIAVTAANLELYSAAQRKIQYLSALHECSRDIGPAADVERVLEVTTTRMSQLLNLSRTAVLFRDADAAELVGAAARGFSAEDVHGLRASLSELPGAAGVFSGGHAWVGYDANSEGLLPAEFARREKVGPVLAVPIIAHHAPIGLLIGDRGGEPFHLTTDELELATIFANQAAVWITNARLLVQEQAAGQEAQAAHARFRDFLELAPDAIVLVACDGRITLVNSQAEQMFGYSRSELIDQPVEVLLPDRYRHSHVRHRSGYHEDPRTRPMGAGLDLLARRKDGTEFPVEISLSPSRNNVVISVIRDVTDRKQALQERERLLASEREKSDQLKLAIREAHHRIKNNLQAISDLLYLELASGGEVVAADVLQESVERIQSIALVHDLLSQDEDVQTVDIRALAERLVPMALRGGGATETVRVQLNVSPVPLSSKKATVLALIINELVSNAVKHVFSRAPGGELLVRLAPADEGLLLRIQDNGPGLPKGFRLSRDANVGLEVVRTLAERDLAGKFTLTSGPGLTADVWFPW